MDFRQLNYFVAVAQALSFSRAARTLHISQPPLSQQIKLLERDLGVQLFDRTRRAVELTHAGSLFYEQAVAILEQYASAKELCAWSADGRAGKLRIAFTASVPIFEAFPRLIHSFHAAYPRIEMDLLHMSTGEQLLALNNKQIDVGFLRPSLNFRPALSRRLAKIARRWRWWRQAWEFPLFLILTRVLHRQAWSSGVLKARIRNRKSYWLPLETRKRRLWVFFWSMCEFF